MTPIALADYRRIVFFVGAGMSAESGVPTYRGAGGIWEQYRYQDYACQRAFERDPGRVLDFHELRRQTVAACAPHAGHAHLAAVQRTLPGRVAVVTQNIDGLLQRAGIAVSAELHGSLWRVRCAVHGVWADLSLPHYASRTCPRCASPRPVRPDITWFEDGVDEAVFATAFALAEQADLFVAVGCSGVVQPAASVIACAQAGGAHMVEVNPELSAASGLFDVRCALPASRALPKSFLLP